MAISEFDLIARYFAAAGAQRTDVPLGIGDDGAVLACPAGCEVVAVTDTLVEGTHFLPGSSPASIGHRALAVNLSDVAAMGARPAWALLALTLPAADEGWLAAFAHGLGALARRFGVALVGGDTTSGPLCITVQLLGLVERGRALRRSGGRAGDVLFVSGSPGDAAAGLALERHPPATDTAETRFLRERFLYPEPRVALGEQLCGWASACIDLSDGLAGDLGKLAAASGCGATLEVDDLPLSAALRSMQGPEGAWRLALAGGDDYELLFAVPPARMAAMSAALPAGRWGYRRIGALCAEPGLHVTRGGGVIEFSHRGYEHFSG